MEKLLFMLTGLLIWGSVSYGQVASKNRWGNARTTDSLNETRPGYVLIPAAGRALKALIDSNTVALARRQPLISATSRVVSGTYVATMFQVPGATDAETAQNRIIRAPNGGLEIGGNMRFGTGGLTAGGNVDIKPDGNLLISTNTNSNRSMFWHPEGITVNRGATTARAGFDVGSSTYLGGDVTLIGSMLIPSADGRYIGFDGLSAGQTVRLRMGDPTGGIDATSGQALVFKGYHGTVLQNQSGGTGPGLRVNGMASNRNITEFYDAANALRAAMSQTGQLTVNGGLKFSDGTTLTTAPTGGGSSAITYAASLAELAAATTRLVVFDGSTWVRVTGTVSTDPGANNLYFATQYNSGSDHYERQFIGRAKFEWWKPASSNTWEQMKYATNSRLSIQVANGDYYFNERVYITPQTKVYGNEVTPDSVRFHITGPNPYLFMSWYWFDGNTAGTRAEGIVLDGFSLYNESSYVAKKDTNDFYGPISIDGGGSFNNVIRNINYKQVSSTAIVNAILVKMGTKKPGVGLLIDNIRSLPSSVKSRMLVEVLNQGDGYNSSSPERDQVPAKGVELRNCIADNCRFGLSVAGNFAGAYIHHNIVRNCTDYGIEVAGPQPGVRVEHNGFGGTQNVLIAGNAEGSVAADYMAAGQGQIYRDNYTEGTITGGGIIEIRGGGDLVFTNNKLRIGGGVFLRRTSAGGVTSADFSNNLLVSSATASNMSNKALLYLAGAINVRGTNNTFIRTSSDTQPYIQAVVSSATSGYSATGVPSTGGLFFNNMFLGTTAPSTYFSAASPNSLTAINNINQSGAITN
jgi:hypothetical protein